MSALKKIGHYYNKIEEYCLVGILGLCVIIIFLQVIMRYAFNNSLSWSEEACKYLFVWMIWLGTSIAVKLNGHLRIEVITGKLKGRAKYSVDVIDNLIWLAFCLFLAVNGSELVMSMMERGKNASSIPWLKTWVVYLAIPFSQGVLGIRVFLNIIKDIRKLKHPDSADETQEKGDQ